MSLSMYQASVPVFVRQLGALSNLLTIGATYAAEHKIDPATLVTLRLAPDMLPLSRQIQIATDGPKGCAARLAGIENPVFEDTETTLDELQARIAKTIAFLDAITPEQIDGTEDKAITVVFPQRTVEFIGQPYLLNFVLPNLYFHVSIAYALLRANGVPVGKMDYLNATL